MSSETFLYFGYGSNMLTARLRRRTPSAEPVGVAILKDHSLKFRKRSVDGSGKCDIVAAPPKHVVYGVVFRMNASEKNALDTAEGFGKGYDRKSVRVALTNGSECECVSYYATTTDESLTPYDWYLALVSAGAEQHGLPSEYREFISTQISRADLKPDRQSRREALDVLEEYRKTKNEKSSSGGANV